MSLRFFLGDVETTGPTPKDKVVEIAWFELDETLNVIDKQHSLIDPQMKISAGASGVHGLTNADVEFAPTIEEFFDEVVTKPVDGDIVLIAHNVIFDNRYFSPHMNIVGQLCTLRLARRVWPTAENHKLATLMYELGLTRGTSHRADGDVETTLDLLRRIVAAMGRPLIDLAEESMKPVFVEVLTFGKHKGKRLDQLPRSYIDWLMGTDNLDRDLRYSLDLVLAGKVPA
jgi:DNA polymerase III epsilon subunit-like protein